MKLTQFILASLFVAGPVTYALDEIEQAEQSTSAESNQASYLPMLKERYALTDEQIKAMQDKGLKANQIAVVSQLAKSSGKSVEEVSAMRVDQKMGWGAIAKSLGVQPKEIGQSVSSLHRKDMGREAREDRKADTKEAKAARKAERSQAKEHKGKSH